MRRASKRIGGDAKYNQQLYLPIHPTDLTTLKRCGSAHRRARPSTTPKSRSFCRSDRPELRLAFRFWQTGAKVKD